MTAAPEGAGATRPSDRWIAPWDGTQCAVLNAMQKRRDIHPYTCPGEMATCRRQRKLIATADGWICVCGAYRQTWAHAVPKFVAERALARAAPSASSPPCRWGAPAPGREGGAL